MIKSMLFSIMMIISFSGFSQVFLLQEFFDDQFKLSATWTSIDKDEDGHNWRVSNSGTNGFAVSDSWMSGVTGALTPENYLISPKVDLTGLSGTVKLRYTIQVPDPVLVEEHYKVAVSTSGKKVADFKDIVMEETCTTDDFFEVYPYWHERIVDLTPYIGKNIYLTWCHFYCTNMYQIFLDSIQVSNTPEVNITYQERSGITIYPNPANENLFIAGTFENAQMQLFTTEGRQVYQSVKVTKQALIDVSHLENGIYILKINSQKGIVTKKITVSH